MSFGCFAALFAKFKQSCSLLSSKVCKSNKSKAFLYVLNLSPKISTSIEDFKYFDLHPKITSINAFKPKA